ncbi:MAG: endonuclease [Frankiales bacterium]|nr:endonuclease [Frankiales bacterium]
MSLLTWNPDRFEFGEARYASHVQRTRAGGTVPMSWGTGQNRNRISPGDTLFLLRQGSRGRGLVAAGHATSGIDRDPTFDPASRSGNFVEVEWTVVLPLVDLLSTDELLARVPGVPWKHIFASGFTVAQEAAADLALLWDEHLEAVGWREGRRRTARP